MSQPKMLDLVFVFIGILFIGLGIPLAMGKIGPNGLYGFRTAKTLASPEIWYSANRTTGVDLIAAGAVILLTAVVVLFIGKEYDMKTVGIINLAALIISVGAAVVHSAMAVGKL